MLGAFALSWEWVMQRMWWMIFVVSGISLAIWAEAGKVLLGIPGRHCDLGEMMLNLAGFVAGFLLNVAIVAFVRKQKEVSQ